MHVSYYDRQVCIFTEIQTTVIPPPGGLEKKLLGLTVNIFIIITERFQDKVSRCGPGCPGIHSVA